MSDVMKYGFDVISAKRYNEKYAKEVGWYGNIPEAAIICYPCLAHDAVNGTESEKSRFVIEVYAFQCDFFPDKVEQDGKFGKATWIKMLKTYANVPDDSNYVIWDNLRHATPAATVTAFDDILGYDLHRAGNFGKRKSKPRLIVLHWGGSTVHGLYKYFNNPKVNLSTHFGIGPEGAFQFLDIAHCAWHARYVNDFAIGVDICQQPTRDYYDYYMSQGYDIDKILNPTSRGRKDLISLDSRIAVNTRSLVFALCRVLDIPIRAPRGIDGLGAKGDVWHGTFKKEVLNEGRFTGVVGHHHVATTKYDIAPWWQSIFWGTDLGDTK